MSWDYDDYDQREQDYYDTRCYPDEYDTYEEYKLEHENGGGSYSGRLLYFNHRSTFPAGRSPAVPGTCKGEKLV